MLLIWLFLIPASILQLVKERLWYVLSCLWDGTYKRSLADDWRVATVCTYKRALAAIKDPLLAHQVVAAGFPNGYL